MPGIFLGAVLGAQAVVAHQNSLGGFHGRKFDLEVAAPGGWQLSDLQWLEDKYPQAITAVGSLFPGAEAAADVLHRADLKGGKYQRLDPAKGYRCEPGGYFKG